VSCSNDCATIGSYTILLLLVQSSPGNIPSLLTKSELRYGSVWGAAVTLNDAVLILIPSMHWNCDTYAQTVLCSSFAYKMQKLHGRRTARGCEINCQYNFDSGTQVLSSLKVYQTFFFDWNSSTMWLFCLTATVTSTLTYLLTCLLTKLFQTMTILDFFTKPLQQQTNIPRNYSPTKWEKSNDSNSNKNDAC